MLASRNPSERLREIIHQNPLAVFWVSPTNQVIDAGGAHNENPPNGDRSVLSDTLYKGFLRGRAAYIDGILYIVIYYWPRDRAETARWKKRVKQAEQPLLQYLDVLRDVDDGGVFFVGEDGHTVT